MSTHLGVDIGGTNVKCVVVRDDGSLVESRTFPTGDAENAWAGTVVEAVHSLEFAHGTAASVGVSSPGLAARDGRSIVWMQGRMAGVVGFDWTRHLARGSTVPVVNDAHAALLGEAWIGAARGARNAVMLTLGTGVGGAVLCDGRILKGRLGRAGHLGHITVDAAGPLDIVNTPGSLEDAVGDCTVAKRTGGRFACTSDLLLAAREGDDAARRAWARSVQALAAGVASIINVVDPELVVVGGGIAKAGDALFVPLADALERFEWRPTGERVRIVSAALGDLAGAFGAARAGMLGGLP